MKRSAASSKVDQKQKLQHCQFELVKLDQDVKSKINAIAVCDGPMSVLNKLCHNVREKLTESTNKIAELEEFQRILKSHSEKDELVVVVKRYATETAKNLLNLRRATLSALKNIESSERSQLMSKNDDDNGVDEIRRSTNLAQESATFSDNLTNLLRTMDSQVRQSEETLKALVGSSQILSETETEFRSMGANIGTSGKLLSKYGRREFTDRILFVLALLFFFGTVFYIVKKRLF